MIIDEIAYYCGSSGTPCDRQLRCDGCDRNPIDADKINRYAEPVHIYWEPAYDGIEFPVCPSCGEMPYDWDRCIFCGQRFIPEHKKKQRVETTEIQHMDCFFCGAKDAIQFVRAYNGHRHGSCSACGIVFME